MISIPDHAAIRIAKNASEPERYAAKQLSEHLRQCSGLDWPILKDPPEAPFEIRIGSAARISADVNRDESFRIRVSDDGADIAGMGTRGAVYGVYAFLEEVIGYRWYTSRITRIPEWTGRMAEADFSEAPAFSYREVYWRDATDGDFALRCRLNSCRADIPAEHGGRVMFYNYSHTFQELVPPDVYFNTHPEYFSKIGGKRVWECSQLCLSNPDVLRIVSGRVLEWMDARPDCAIFSVAQNDWRNNCQCDACRAIDEEEGSPSGSLLRFVNAVADAVGEKHPGKYIHTFAYMYTRRPPRITRPRDNVIVRLCSIEACFSHPLSRCAHSLAGVDVMAGAADSRFEKNDEPLFARDLSEWSQICKNLYIWDYTVNFANYLQPFPNLSSLQPNIQLFRDCGVQGVFEQGNYSPGWASALSGLKVYLLSKLLWNPDCDIQRHSLDFLQGVFGAGAGYIREYMNIMQEAVRGYHAGIYDRPDAPYLNDVWLEKADELVQKAEQAAETPMQKTEAARERLSVRYARLARLPLDSAGRIGQIAQFARDAKALGITELFERRAFDASITVMEKSRYARERSGLSYTVYRL